MELLLKRLMDQSHIKTTFCPMNLFFIKMSSDAKTQKLKKELYDIIATHSGQTYDKVWGDSDRDYWMIAQEAKEYGMIDEVLRR